MSEPRIDYKDKLSGAISELISAQSALNMTPSPIQEPEGEFLIDLDSWVAHANEHICAAIDLVAQEAGMSIHRAGYVTIIKKATEK